MATNATERSKTLQEIMDWLSSKINEEYEARQWAENFAYHDGMFNAFQQTVNRCQDMLLNLFECQRDELTTMDMHTCDLCGKRVSSPVYSVLLAYNGQSKTATEVCADCMQHLNFKLTKIVPMAAYRDYERWLAEHPRKGKDAE